MKKILGLDIGTTSIGWAIVEAEDKSKIATTEADINNDRIAIHKDAVGVRIIPADEMQRRFDLGQKLNEGEKLTPTANRRIKRGSRRMKSRYKLRRDKLNKVLGALGMLPNGEFYTSSKGKRGEGNDIGRAIYELRDKASREPISSKEWGRILLHLNQWRGYSSDRFSKEEKASFDYYTGIIVELSDSPLHTEFEDKAKTKVKWYKFKLTIKLDEPIKEKDGKMLNEITGYIFIQKVNFKVGDVFTFKYEQKETKEKKKIIETYYKINQTQPNPLDWNYRYQTLNKNLTEWYNEGKTVGSYFFQKFYIHKSIDRIRNNIVNRNWYEAEFDKIWEIQYEQYKEKLEQLSIDDILEIAFKDKNVRSEVKNKAAFKDQLKYLIKEKIIYYQRPWQQVKNKGECRFEKVKKSKERINQKTKQTEKYEIYEGRTVIPRSHPLHQEFKIWQQINNVRLWCINKGRKTELFADSELFKLKTGKEISDVKQLLYQELLERKAVTWRVFAKETLGLNITLKDLDYLNDSENTESLFNVNFSREGKDGKPMDKPLDGNKTLVELRNIVNNVDGSWFNKIVKTGHDHPYKNKTKTKEYNYKSCKYETNNLQLLWETIYDITNPDEKKVKDLIKKHFGFSDSECETLSKVKFDDSGMGNLSAKAIRKILPLMKDGSEWKENQVPSITRQKIDSLIQLNNDSEEKQLESTERLRSLMDIMPDKNTRARLSQFSSITDFKGLNYWEAAAVVYGQHSKSGIHSGKISADEIDKRIQPVKPHSMNNPVVEKIVNETLSVVKAIYKKYGFDEVRIELSRELKASREEREQMWDGMVNNQKRNEWAKMMLRELKEETGAKNIDRIKLYEDVVKQRFSDEYKEKTKEYKLNEPAKADVQKYLMWIDQKLQCPYTREIISISELFSGAFDVDHIIPKERYYDNAYSNKVICRKYVNKDLKGSLLPYELLKAKRPGDDKIKDSSGNYIMKNGDYVRLLTWEEFQDNVKEIFPKSRKQANLLRKEIPEDPIARQLKETQYINKKIKEELSKVVGSDKVWTTTGAITDILRQNWHLDDVMKELVRDRFEEFEVGVEDKKEKELHSIIIPKYVDEETGEVIPEKFIIRSGKNIKRLDHRHHALDALIIACTKQHHIQYINTLNTQYTVNIDQESEVKKKYAKIRQEICVDNSKTKYKTPWHQDQFIPQIKSVLENVLISQKNINLLISPSKNRNNQKLKTASLRGALHKETNYAKRSYYEGGTKMPIDKLVEEILWQKYDNQNQTIIFPRSFENIIKQTVFKEKFQLPLISFFEEYEKEKFNNNKKTARERIKTIKKSILNSLNNHEVFKNIEWATTFSAKGISARPTGLSMNLNDKEEIESIANPHICDLAKLRLKYIEQKQESIKANTSMDKDEKDKQVKELLNVPLFSNGIYKVKAKTKDGYEWVYLPNISSEQIEKIHYEGKPGKTNKIRSAVKERLREFNGDIINAFSSVFENPIFISQNKIEVKKARQKSYFQNVYEIHSKKFVQPSDNTFMVYIFQNDKGDREKIFLKFIDAIRIIDNEKPDKIKYNELIEPTDRENFKLAFTLQSNDLIYMPESNEKKDEIDFSKIASISDKLYSVKDMNPSQNKIVIQKHTIADSIELTKDDIKQVVKDAKAKDIIEEIKYGTVDMLDTCIKVFTDKLGKKVVPYWKFPKGCWDNERAKELDLT